MKTEDWTHKRFVRSRIPHWKCPTCNSATLILENQIIEKPSSEAQNFPKEYYNEYTGNNEPYPDIEDFPGLNGRFSFFLRCPNITCKEHVQVSGVMNSEFYYYNEEYSHELVNCYCPKYIDPPIHIINIHENYPERIKNILTDSFLLYWIDNSACANKIRTAIEFILDEIKIQKRVLNKKKKYEKLSLHKRIEILEKKDKKTSSYLMSIKWIGNSGSHLDTLTNTNVLDAYELLDKALNRLFVKDEERLESLSKKINRMKKPF
ncbi:DUF4145 domain-containing protein [Catalinimonas sp. 4WD22]|uniref:DUF4145 domain-containing protein n=1 Tax=Catalinimonas locisalis TaxID=3133978 RepID=UPI003100EB30